MPGNESRSATVQRLAQQLRRIERSHAPVSDEGGAVSTGIAALDGLLPENGLRRGSLAEWLVQGEGCGAATLVFHMLPRVMGPDGSLIVIDSSRGFYPPAASRFGVDLARTIVVRPGSAEDAVWAAEQSLRCPGVAAVACWVDALASRVFRRLQLAVEAGGGLGFLLRPARFQPRPSWADVRLRVTPLPSPAQDRPPPLAQPPGRRVRVELLSCRGGESGNAVELEISDETGVVRLAPRLAPATHPGRAVRA